MAHDRDHDRHAPPSPAPSPAPLESRDCPDRKRREHPDTVPREPVDPKTHPNRRPVAALRVRPA